MLYAMLLFAADQPATGEGPPLWSTLLIYVVPLVFLFYFMILRPNQRQERERQSMTSNLKKNDEVLTRSGIYGTVVSVSDTKDEIVLKIDDNVRIRVVKDAILRNLTQEEAARQQKETKEAK